MILAADIGGTKTLLALFEAGQPRFEQRYPSDEYGSFDDLLGQALDEAAESLGGRPRIDGACFGVAGPVADGRVDVTNLPWILDAGQLASSFELGHVRLLNDFAANAHGIAALAPQDLATLQSGAPLAQGPQVLIGAGTGLGVAYVLHDGSSHRVVASEGGHAGFAPTDDAQAALWQFLHKRLGRVEVEHVVSGPGLARIHAHLRASAAASIPEALEREIAHGDAGAAITRFALAGTDPVAAAALDLFIACYGAVAGDHALHVVARGGVFVAGGIAPKIVERLAAGGFMRAFNDKGAFTDLVRSIPVHVVLNERLGLLGAARVATMR